VAERIRTELDPDDYVLPAQRWRNPPVNSNLFRRVASRAGVRGRMYPHLMRHAFAEEITRHAGLRYALHLLGHADSRTTEIYLGQPTPAELQAAIEGFTFGAAMERARLSTQNILANAVEAPTGIEPV
jgi:integrase